MIDICKLGKVKATHQRLFHDEQLHGHLVIDDKKFTIIIMQIYKQKILQIETVLVYWRNKYSLSSYSQFFASAFSYMYFFNSNNDAYLLFLIQQIYKTCVKTNKKAENDNCDWKMCISHVSTHSRDQSIL